MSAERQWPNFEWSPEAIEAGDTAHRLASRYRKWPHGYGYEHPDEPAREWNLRRMEAALNAAVREQPVVALPPCPACKGDGTDHGCGYAFCRPRCPACNGSGVEWMVPAAALRAWIEERPSRGCTYKWALDDLSVFLDSLHAEETP